MSKNVPLSARILLLVIFSLATSACLLAQLPKSDCTAAEHHQFDFWLGDWDVFEADGVTKAAHVRVERALDGCALRELYEDGTGMKGESLSAYDATRKVWHQTWMTNRGQLLMIEGKMQGDAMVLSGTYRDANGKRAVARGTWKPVADGVRETAVTSTDGGKTWKPWFDLLFRKRSANASDDDAKTVAALDTEYQRAVKNNDAATMDRILSDDFILVVGAGQSFTKSDLINDAKIRSTTYEHQEDTEQTVRVWGDTAVITAKLWEKGTQDGKPFDKTLWFSDTYVRSPQGWRYVFGQASLPLPKAGEQ
jgi:ketosteroid isomerase-like protein